MRFPQLKIGQEFIFQDKQYTKTGPMTASETESGKRCMIRRSAEVTPLAFSGGVKKTLPTSFTKDQVVELLQAYKIELKTKLLAAFDGKGAVPLSDLLSEVDSLEVMEFLTSNN